MKGIIDQKDRSDHDDDCQDTADHIEKCLEQPVIRNPHKPQQILVDRTGTPVLMPRRIRLYFPGIRKPYKDTVTVRLYLRIRPGNRRITRCFMQLKSGSFIGAGDQISPFLTIRQFLSFPVRIALGQDTALILPLPHGQGNRLPHRNPDTGFDPQRLPPRNLRRRDTVFLHSLL